MTMTLISLFPCSSSKSETEEEVVSEKSVFTKSYRAKNIARRAGEQYVVASNN